MSGDMYFPMIMLVIKNFMRGFGHYAVAFRLHMLGYSHNRPSHAICFNTFCLFTQKVSSPAVSTVTESI